LRLLGLHLLNFLVDFNFFGAFRAIILLLRVLFFFSLMNIITIISRIFTFRFRSFSLVFLLFVSSYKHSRHFEDIPTWCYFIIIFFVVTEQALILLLELH